MGSNARIGEKTAWICCEEPLSGRKRWSVTEMEVNALNRISNGKTWEVSTCQKGGVICLHKFSVSCCKLKGD